MLFISPIRNLVVCIAIALLARVACAQEAEFSFDAGKVPAEVAEASSAEDSTEIQFSQLPTFTAPKEGADELIGFPVGQESLAVETGTAIRASADAVEAFTANRSPVDILPVERVTVKPIAKRTNAVQTLEAASVPLTEKRRTQSWPFQQSVIQREDAQEGVVQSNPFFQDDQQVGQVSWEANPHVHVKPKVEAQAVTNADVSPPISDFFAPSTASTIDRQTGLIGTSSLIKASGTELTDPITPEPAVLKTKSAEPAKATAKKATKKEESDLPNILQGNKNFKLAAQPEQGAHFRDDRPQTDPRAHQIETLEQDFSPGPSYDGLSYFSHEQQNIYSGKKLYANQRPLVELGRPWYQLGQLSKGFNIFGNHNQIAPQFLIYGDFRSAIASNNVGGDGTTRTASELNLDFDLKLTGTERFHMFMSPLDNGVQNTGYNFDNDEFEDQFDANIDFGYFEGDLGAMVGGFTGETLPFDLPFAIGVMPLLIQNGVWFEDAFLGVAATIPARNSARFNISNMDITFFAGYDKINSPAFPGDDSAARMYGVASFIEALNGYIEIDYAFLDDRSFDNRSYHNFAFAYSRRYGRLVSNSTRIIVNAGQASDVVENTADGVLLLSENSLITGAPSSLVPYFNCFAGFDRPQSAARAVQAGGVLRNTGILFETDGMTGFPTLDPTANDTYGAALGLNLLADDFSQQLLVEVAALGVMGEDNARNAPGEQIGVGFRYQLPLSNSKILRMDGMYGFLNNADDISGIRMELRQKW